MGFFSNLFLGSPEKRAAKLTGKIDWLIGDDDGSLERMKDSIARASNPAMKEALQKQFVSWLFHLEEEGNDVKGWNEK